MKKPVFSGLTRQKISGAAAIVAYAAAGVLLLVWPQIMAGLAMWALIVLLCATGGYHIYKYLKASPVEGAKGFRLAGALMALALALAILIDGTLLNQVMPRIWGALLLAGGFVKVQFGVDFYRMKNERWWWLLIGAAVSLALGVLAMSSPEFIKAVLARFIGASLVVEAAIDLAALILIRRKDKEAKNGAQAAEKPEQAPKEATAPAANEASAPAANEAPVSESEQAKKNT